MSLIIIDSFLFLLQIRPEHAMHYECCRRNRYPQMNYRREKQCSFYPVYENFLMKP